MAVPTYTVYVYVSLLTAVLGGCVVWIDRLAGGVRANMSVSSVTLDSDRTPKPSEPQAAPSCPNRQLSQFFWSDITCSAAVQPATDVRQNGAAGRGLRPFDAQLAAARDRRSIGLYDARFHSTSWCVHCCSQATSIGAAIQDFF